MKTELEVAQRAVSAVTATSPSLLLAKYSPYKAASAGKEPLFLIGSKALERGSGKLEGKTK